VVIELPKEKILCEVKYRNKPELPANDTIVTLSDGEDARVTASFVVTKNLLDCGIDRHNTEVPIFRIPALPFLYLLGRAEAAGEGGKM
jgi:hypothetical protein